MVFVIFIAFEKASSVWSSCSSAIGSSVGSGEGFSVCVDAGEVLGGV
jgi:hypothetical protein